MIRNIAASSNYQSAYSVWHTPVPYIFGGVGAVISFVGFALFILACSHCKKSRGYSEETNLRLGHSRESNIGLYGQSTEIVKNITTSCSSDDEKVVVIMAGDTTPSVIAKPISASAIWKPQHVAGCAEIYPLCRMWQNLKDIDVTVLLNFIRGQLIQIAGANIRKVREGYGREKIGVLPLSKIIS